MALNINPESIVARTINYFEPTKTGKKKAKTTVFIRKIYGDELAEYEARIKSFSLQAMGLHSKNAASESVSGDEFEEVEDLAYTDRELILAYVEDIPDLENNGEKIEYTPELLEVIAGIKHFSAPLAEEIKRVHSEDPVQNGTTKN